MLDTPMIGMCKCMWLSKERDVTKVVVHSILFVMIKLFSCTTFSDKTSKINCMSPSISSSIERTYHRWVSTMVNWTLTYIWSVVRSQENDSDFSRISRSAVRYSSAHMDSPIIFEKVDQGKKSGTCSPVCTTIYPVLFVKMYLLAVHIHQVVLLPSSIPSDLSPFSWGHSFHSRIKLVGCMQSSRVYISCGLPTWPPWHMILVYKKYGSTCLTSTTFWDAIPTYWFADADAIQAVCSDGSTYTKDLGAVCSLASSKLWWTPYCVPLVRHNQHVRSQHGNSRRSRVEKASGHRKIGIQRDEQCVCLGGDNPDRQRVVHRAW